MTKIIAIVEGHGELEAVPLLIRRIASEREAPKHVQVLRPIRVPRGKLVIREEFSRALELAARQVSESDGILVLLDADSDCPVEVAGELRRFASEMRPDRRVRVVLPKAEYEAWFLASARSLAGQRNLRSDLVAPPDPERVTDPKGWITRNSNPGSPYRETLDQPAYTGLMSLEEARRAPSFDKLIRDVEALLAGTG